MRGPVVNVYFANTSGVISDTVSPRLAVGARVVICGTASISSGTPGRIQHDRHLASGDLCRESAPLRQGSRASLFVDLPRDEMTLLIELVVDLGVN